MEFSQTIEHSSLAFPDGVKFTTRRMGISNRTETELATAALRARQRELHRDLAPFYERDKAEYEQLGKLQRELLAADGDALSGILDAIDEVKEKLAQKPDALVRQSIEEQLRLTDRQVETPWVKAGLVSIEGITVEGKPLTVAQLCEYGPRELFAEVFQAIWDEAYMSTRDTENLRSRTISGPKADGPIASSTAPSAEVQAADGTRSEIAAAISPTK